jgi:hypothetical protein
MDLSLASTLNGCTSRIGLRFIGDLQHGRLRHGGGWVVGHTVTDRQASRLQYARSIKR